ncbi:MAG: Trypsin-like peptidase domain-containing protein [uncultured Campylobacterales bacterium]|uniref:Trypsin-like peptidase domain-containing protein n=1 Tax=uncultured Campylobacterales bacterium TaxID=352960 RepID=A0A6S6SYR9_9BACT|nr:MAG: Trypsin-like peptidase domain-containing protein [uncultured Campylobacterales bacterium]
MNLGPIEQLVHSTVRIETILRNGGNSTGTGFYMNFLQNGDSSIPVIVTNKHVIAGAQLGRFHVTTAGDDGAPNLGSHQQFQIENFEDQCVLHPDPKVDLAVFPIGPLLNQVKASGDKLFYMALPISLIPSDSIRSDLSSMEEIVMIGYPNGIWDSKNNLPVIRKGITATHTNISWNGNTEFLTDIASFPGSSGSPVFLANIGGYMDSRGNTIMVGNRIFLLGIHYAGAMHTATGEIKIVTAPTSNIPMPITQIPNNIGVAINSNRILELETLVKSLKYS